MGRGRPRRAIQRNREEEISHGIASSSAGNAAQMEEEIGVIETTMNTPKGDPHTIAGNTGKEKSIVVEQWPELSKYSGKGTGSQQDSMKTNGTVT
ncbi:hypothetical protein RDI58_013740 [Solanum bulbocastanum]|uniref:Uncharacterized protein n=1 Tax=Solanum bulbocastanum TaxID=147425 RepID=A0AAN8YEF5_SOLBU